MWEHLGRGPERPRREGVVRTFRFAPAGILALLAAAVIPAHAALVINPTYDTTITTDLNSTAIISVIQQALNTYQGLFASNLTVQIYFQEGNTSYEHPGGVNNGPECILTPTGLGILNGNVPNICTAGSGGVFDGIISLDIRDTPMSQLLALAEHELELFFGPLPLTGQSNGTGGTLLPNGTPDTITGFSTDTTGSGTPGGTGGSPTGGTPGGNPPNDPTGGNAATVPEPGTYAMLAGALAVLGLKRRRPA